MNHDLNIFPSLFLAGDAIQDGRSAARVGRPARQGRRRLHLRGEKVGDGGEDRAARQAQEGARQSDGEWRANARNGQIQDL